MMPVPSRIFAAFLDSLALNKTARWAFSLLHKLPLVVCQGSGVCQPICHCSFNTALCFNDRCIYIG